MRVLVLESLPGASDDVDRALVGSGHRTVRCHAPGHPDGPCQLDLSGPCPLDAAPVDVAVVAGPVGSEKIDGARCAARDGVPVVRLGDLGSSSPDAVMLDGAIRDAVAANDAGHEAAATEALVEVLIRHGVDREGAVATVDRRGGRLAVSLAAPHADAHTLDVAAVRALAAVRRMERRASTIDVIASA